MTTTECGSIDPIIQEEKRLQAVAERVKGLESQLAEAVATIERLKVIIMKHHENVFPPECKSPNKY